MNTRLTLPLVLVALMAQGCVYVSQKVREEKEREVDQDGDGAMFAGPGADCDDLDPARSPKFLDIPYDGIDNDCKNDGDLLDIDGDGVAGIRLVDWPNYVDEDDDGGWPDGLDRTLVDCQDTDLLDDEGNVVRAGNQVFPGNTAAELPYDGIDSDCGEDNDFDVDGDGFLPDRVPETGADLQSAFEAYVAEWGYTGRFNTWFEETGSPRYGDCDDSDASAFPSNDEDAPYDGVDSNCDGVNDFDPDGDGFMPPELPDGSPTQPAYNAFRAKYGLSYTLPDEVVADPPDAKAPLTLGPFSDCLDLLDPRPGATQFDAASIYPRAYSAAFGDNGDLPWDGIDTDCNRDNDYDADRDAFIKEGEEVGYENYLSFWNYEDELPRWGAVNAEYPLGEPKEGDCKDTDPLTYPAALEIVGESTVVDQDCDGEGNAGRFWFEGPVGSELLEWRRPGKVRVSRVGDVYMAAAMVEGFSINEQLEGLNPGVAVPFTVAGARSQALPSSVPFRWKIEAANHLASPALDLISLDRCLGDAGEDVAYVAVQYNISGAGLGYVGWYGLTENSLGNAVSIADVADPPGPDISVGSAPGMDTTDAVIGLDGNCDPFLAGISDTHMYVAHGRNQIPSLSLLVDGTVSGSALYASYTPQVLGEDPAFGFVVCGGGTCEQRDFDLNAAGLPRAGAVVDAGQSWRAASSTFSKDENLVVAALPDLGPGLAVIVDGTVRVILATDTIVAAQAQLHDGELYVAAIINNGVESEMVLAFGDPTGTLEIAELKWNPANMPLSAIAAQPVEIGLFVDDDRVAIAASFWDAAPPELGVLNDAIGWLFLDVE